MNNFLLAAGNTQTIIWLVLLIGMVIAMLILPSMSQKKRAKAYQEMQDKLRSGDKVQTVGGIVGKIHKIKETNGVKTVFIETGDKNNKTVIEFDINAIAGVVEGIPNPNASAPQVDEVENTIEPENFDVSYDDPILEQVVEESQKEKSKKKKN